MYLLNAHQERRGPIPDWRKKTLVETAQGFGVTFGLVKDALLNLDMQSVNPSASVSLPWEIPDTDSGRDKRKEGLVDVTINMYRLVEMKNVVRHFQPIS